MRRSVGIWGAVLAVAVATCGADAAQAQDFGGPVYSFLKAVKERDGNKVTTALSTPGNTLIVVKDDQGDDALHIVTKRRDATWMQFMLAKGAPVNSRDRGGNTALVDATQIGFTEGEQLLLSVGADPNLANDRGETPLILATQNHDLPSVRLLVQYGADPAIADHVAGLSAMDYAKRDSRATVILKLLQEAKPQAKKDVAGPSVN